MNLSDVVILCGNSVPRLGHGLADALGIRQCKAKVGRFADGESEIELYDNMRGKVVCLVQSTCAPTNHHLMELILMADACRRASAERVFALVPYFGYSRQDRRVRSRRVPISAKVAAEMMQQSGISRIVTMDVHSEQMQGFVDIPVDNIYTTGLFAHEVAQMGLDRPIVISPDVGGVVRARALARACANGDLAIIDKRRSDIDGRAQALQVIGDVRNKDCLVHDDIVDSAGTLCSGATALMEAGANSVTALVTHPVLSAGARERVEKSDLDMLVVSNSIAVDPSPKIRQIDCTAFLADALERVINAHSLSSLWEDPETLSLLFRN